MNIPTFPRSPSMEILHDVARECDVTVDELRGKSRAFRVSHPRQEVYRRLHAHGWSLTKIAQFMGGRDHTTVLHGLRAVRQREAAQ